MKISVIIPAYNAEKYVEEAIQSIIGQTYENWELLVCDDASTDRTLNIITNIAKTDQRISVFSNDKNLYKPLTVHKLVQEATGDLFTFHDADDTSHPERFQKIVAKFKLDPEIGMCGHTIQRMTEDGTLLNSFRSKIDNYDESRKNMKILNTDGDPSIFVKKEVIDSLKWVYRPFFTNSMDYDFALRVMENYRTANLLETLSFYRNVSGSISKGVDNFRKFLMPEFAKIFAKQRSVVGVDSLTKNDHDEIRKIELELSQPYLSDKTLHLRKMIDFFVFVYMDKSAYQYSVKALKKEPLKWVNWKYFLIQSKNYFLKRKRN